MLEQNSKRGENPLKGVANFILDHLLVLAMKPKSIVWHERVSRCDDGQLVIISRNIFNGTVYGRDTGSNIFYTLKAHRAHFSLRPY